MALLESFSGFRDLFTDPPEFDILHVSRRQQLTNFVRIVLGGLSLLLLAIQMSGYPIACFSHHNQTRNLIFIHETCMDNIKDRNDGTGNAFIILDEYFGWMLVLEIICLMIITKVTARNEKNKQICRRFTELSEKILNTEMEEQKQEGQVNVDRSHLFNIYNVFMKQLRENFHLSRTQLCNSMMCIFLSLVFLVLNVLVLHGRYMRLFPVPCPPMMESK